MLICYKRKEKKERGGGEGVIVKRGLGRDEREDKSPPPNLRKKSVR